MKVFQLNHLGLAYQGRVVACARMFLIQEFVMTKRMRSLFLYFHAPCHRSSFVYLAAFISTRCVNTGNQGPFHRGPAVYFDGLLNTGTYILYGPAFCATHEVRYALTLDMSWSS